ncbi:hypothetical protein B0A48_06625 [Cryoendolithus antarcticus]|uniref:Uncharacterized protein n=1 Tax=Cryoendolithus antarcticus TaxID=1507870 RepID=A0A1V8T980_9PEZI|nr:hypothetical protein B0A48_06625 [Cryoendolithus antarcticus]
MSVLAVFDIALLAAPGTVATECVGEVKLQSIVANEATNMQEGRKCSMALPAIERLRIVGWRDVNRPRSQKSAGQYLQLDFRRELEVAADDPRGGKPSLSE